VAEDVCKISSPNPILPLGWLIALATRSSQTCYATDGRIPLSELTTLPICPAAFWGGFAATLGEEKGHEKGERKKEIEERRIGKGGTWSHCCCVERDQACTIYTRARYGNVDTNVINIVNKVRIKTYDQ